MMSRPRIRLLMGGGLPHRCGQCQRAEFSLDFPHEKPRVHHNALSVGGQGASPLPPDHLHCG